jgi:rhodanese-related sulfurtransferase
MSTISPNEAYRRASADDTCVIVDVREDFERQERIPGAVHLPMSRMLREVDELLPRKELYVVCASGGRSLMVAEFLAGKGHAASFSVDGGMLGWKEEGLPLA